ncbi:MAG: hypothetical protein ACJAVK_003313 [Akkermansiaceae bacterium]|jgi:hypothetical protein
MEKKARTIIAAGVLSSCLTCCLSADTFHSINAITSNTSATDLFAAVGLINGPGIDFEPNPPHGTISGGASSLWVTEACGFPCDYYDTFPPPILTLDLGSDQPLNEISIWGYADTNTNGAKRASLRFATDAEGTADFATSVTFAPSFPLLNGNAQRQSFAFGHTITARYVEVTLTDNHFVFPGDGSNNGGIAGGDRVGLGEIAFAVPGRDQDQIFVTAPNEFSLKTGDPGSATLNGLLNNTNYWAVERSSVTGIIYLSVPTDGKIYQVDPSVNPIAISVFVNAPGAVFHGLAVNNEDGILYAADSATDTIKKYTLNTGQADGSLGIGYKRPNEVIHDEASQRIIVSDSGTDAISIYDEAGNLQLAFFDATTVGVWGLVIDPQNGDLLYSSHDLGIIYRRNLTGGSVTVEHDSLQGPRGLGFDRWGQLYCVESTANQVKTFGPSPLTTYTTAGGGRDISILADCDRDGDFLPDAWEATSGGSSLTFMGDADGDGIVNGLEAATGGSTTASDDGSPVELIRNSNGEFTITHQAFKKSALAYTLWLSTDLANWQAAGTLPSRTDGAGLYDTWNFRFTSEDEGFPVDTPRLFSKLGLEPSL